MALEERSMALRQSEWAMAFLIGLALTAEPAAAQLGRLVDATKSPPTKAFIQTGPGYSERLGDLGMFGVVTDACLIVDRIGRNFVSVDASRSAARDMLDGVRALLRGKGYELSYHSVPFVCGSLSPEALGDVDAVDGSEVVGPPPYFGSETVENDRELAEALFRVEKAVRKAVGQLRAAPARLFSEDESITNTLRIVADRTGLRTLLVATSSGVRVPQRKSFLQAMTTGLLTGAATGGLAVYTRAKVSTLDSYVGLVDLERAELIWTNSLRHTGLDPTQPEIYAERWPHDLLYFIPDKGAGDVLTNYGFGYAGNINRDAGGLEALRRLRVKYAQARRRVNLVFGAPKAGNGSLLKCFLLAVINPPSGSFASYIEDTVVAEMDHVGLYSESADTSVEVVLRSLEVDRKLGRWLFGVDLSVAGGKPTRVDYEYAFEVGAQASFTCENALRAFGPAAIGLADALIDHPLLAQWVLAEPMNLGFFNREGASTPN
jgi:hypothetical protein